MEIDKDGHLIDKNGILESFRRGEECKERMYRQNLKEAEDAGAWEKHCKAWNRFFDEQKHKDEEKAKRAEAKTINEFKKQEGVVI